MKITKITISNLASIGGEHVIDFTKEPLKSAGIFAISGPTGSGKSTILDALCLALYDRIPRFQQSVGRARIDDAGNSDISQNDVRNILRRGTGRGFAEVEFVDDNKETYASRWSVHRSHYNPAGKLQNQQIKVMNVTTNMELQGTKTELLSQLERLIGLSYDQFTRTVLLAQNDFATFLKSDENAKAELLEKLTGTDIYSRISMKLYDLTREKNNEVNLVKSQMEAIEVLPEERIKELQKEQSECQVQLKDLRSAQLKATQLKETFDEIKRNDDEFAKKKTTLKEKEELFVKHQETEAKQALLLEQFENQCKLNTPLISRATELDALVVQNKEVANNWLKKVTDAQQERDKKQKEVKEKERTYSRIREEASTIYKSLNLPKKLQDMAAVYEYLELQKSQLQSVYEQKVSEKEQLKLEEVYRQQEVLDKQKTEINKLDSLFKLYTEKSAELSKLQKQLGENIDQHTKMGDQKVTIEESLPEVEKKLNLLKELYEESQRRMNKDVEAIRESLKQGEPCPVCGSTSHQLETSQVHSEYSMLKEKVDALQKKLNEQLTEYKALDKALIQLAKAIKQDTASCKEIKEKCQSYHKDYADEVFNELFIANQLKLFAEQGEKYTRLISQGTKVQKEIDKIVKDKNHIQEQHDKLHKIYDELQEAKNGLDSIQKEGENLQKAYQEKDNEYQQALAKYKELQVQRSKLLGGKTVAAFQAEVEQEALRFKKQKEKLELEKQTLSTDKANLSGQLEQLTVVLKNLRLKVQDITEEDNKKMLLEVMSKIGIVDKKHTEVSSKLSSDKSNQERRKKLEVDLNKLVLAAEDWNKLNTVFGQSDGAKFQVIAQSYTLRILILQANQHLKYLSPRYRLEQIGSDLALKIIDQDMGDAERTVYSLSGGESFLVSLALALGLSSISSGNLQVDSLFIDEGFGSLDTESLRTAMDALEQLQRLGRKVGVISHVQEMSERIAVQIRLEKGTSGQSTLTIG